MFPYYGSKARAVDFYPAPNPLYSTIVEPFAGSAQYALKYFYFDVVLNDLDPVVTDIWRYLVQASPRDILSLPFIERGDDLRRHTELLPAERALIGFHLSGGNAYPINFPTGTGKYNRWNPTRRAKLADNLYKVRHWQILHGDYRTVLNRKAIWFIDPPYVRGGGKYRCSARHLDFETVAQWTALRGGQVIACEAFGASHLPFRRLSAVQGRAGYKVEAVWDKAG